MNVREIPCPKCGAPPGALTLGQQIALDTISPFALLGVGTPLDFKILLTLSCSRCPLLLVGELDEHNHVDFKVSEGLAK